jgi:hypothetical protein
MSIREFDDTAPSAADDSELFDCPTCGSPAEVIDRFVLDGAPGPVEHLKIACVQRHWYTLPVDHPALTRSDGEVGRSACAGVHVGRAPRST